MRFSPTRWLLAVCMGVLVSADTDSMLEVDLVFPRNDTYAPTDWMPIVFAFRNAELARYVNPHISYTVRSWDNMFETDFGISFSHDLRWVNWSSHEPYFTYHYWDDFKVEGRWWLTWSVSWRSCDEESYEKYDDPAIISNSSTWSVLFTTRDGAQEIDLVASTKNETCPEELGVAIDVTDTTKTVPIGVDWYGGDKCAVVASSSPTSTPNPCLVQVDPAITESMAASLHDKFCRGLDPPSDCPEDEDKSAAQQLTVVGLSCLLAAFGAFGFGLMF